MGISKEINHLKGLSEVLKCLAEEVERKGFFDKEDLELLKKVGSDVLFKGVAVDFKSNVRPDERRRNDKRKK